MAAAVAVVASAVVVRWLFSSSSLLVVVVAVAAGFALAAIVARVAWLAASVASRLATNARRALGLRIGAQCSLRSREARGRQPTAATARVCGGKEER